MNGRVNSYLWFTVVLESFKAVVKMKLYTSLIASMIVKVIVQAKFVRLNMEPMIKSSSCMASLSVNDDVR